MKENKINSIYIEKDKDKKADHSGSYGMRAWHWRHILSSCVRY